MVSDGIKAVRIQAQYSPLINSTWPGLAFQANVLLEPGFHCVRTHWIPGFHGVPVGPAYRNVMLMVPA